jgi:hypothetical protein
MELISSSPSFPSSSSSSFLLINEEEQIRMLVQAGLLNGNNLQPVSPQRVNTLTATSSTITSNIKNKKRSVCFSSQCEMHDGITTQVTTCKVHDGLSTRRQILDSLVTHYFVNQREVSELHVLETCKTLQSVKELEEDLIDLRDRIEEGALQGKVSVPVLPEGGGACTKLALPHAPYINVLLQVIDAAYNRASNAVNNNSNTSMELLSS